MTERLRFDCVVFDLDDTLYLERDYVRSGFHAVGEQVLKQFGVRDFGATCWHLFCDGVRTGTLNRTLELCELPTDPESVGNLVHTYRTHKPAITLLPDARTLLAQVRRSCKMGLITDGRGLQQRLKVEALGLQQSFDAIVYTADLGPDAGKPAPAAYVAMEEMLGGHPDGFVYVGDNPAKDFIVPNDRGWYTIRVRRAGGLYAHLEAYGMYLPRVEITSLTALHLPLEFRSIERGRSDGLTITGTMP